MCIMRFITSLHMCVFCDVCVQNLSVDHLHGERNKIETRVTLQK